MCLSCTPPTGHEDLFTVTVAGAEGHHHKHFADAYPLTALEAEREDLEQAEHQRRLRRKG